MIPRGMLAASRRRKGRWSSWVPGSRQACATAALCDSRRGKGHGPQQERKYEVVAKPRMLAGVEASSIQSATVRSVQGSIEAGGIWGMGDSGLRLVAIGLALAGLLAGCTLHPAAERDERRRAEEAGRAWIEPVKLPDLPQSPAPEDYLRYALLGSAQLQAAYWQWRAAIEQIPQDASGPGIAVGFSVMFDGQNMKLWDRTTLSITNDPMSNIPFPSKLSAAGRRALEEARAAGARFQEAKFLLQGRVLWTYYELALLSEALRIKEQEAFLLQMMADQAAVRVKAGAATQSDLLQAQTALDLAGNELQNLRSQVPALVARMNALLGRPADAPVPLAKSFPPPRPVPVSDDELILAGAERSPGLSALAREVAGRQEALSLARQAYLPDFSLMAGVTGNVERMLGGMITLPTQVEAIKASIAQAQASLRAAELARIQYGRDLAASFVLNLSTLRNDERQVELFERVIIPRALQTVEVARASYANNRLSFADLLNARRALLDAKLMVVQLRAEREKALAAIETWSTVDVEAMQPGRMVFRALRMAASAGGMEPTEPSGGAISDRGMDRGRSGGGM